MQRKIRTKRDAASPKIPPLDPPKSGAVTQSNVHSGSIAAVIPEGDRRESLVAIRDRLALETDDTLWAKHKRECNCQCGMGDGRLLVALTKRLSEVLAELAALPDEKSEVSDLDRLADELAPRRATRRTATSGL
jgi:hypothetical protein